MSQLGRHSYNRFDFASSRKILWGAEVGRLPPTVTYDEVMGSEKGVWEWLKLIVSHNHRLCFLRIIGLRLILDWLRICTASRSSKVCLPLQKRQRRLSGGLHSFGKRIMEVFGTLQPI